MIRFIPDTEPHRMENPITIQSESGIAKVTRIEDIGSGQIIWADYGDGVEHPHDPDEIICIDPPEHPPAGTLIEVNLCLYGRRRWLLAIAVERPYGIAALWRLHGWTGEVQINRGLEWRHLDQPTPQAVSDQAQNNTTYRPARRSKKGKASGWIEDRIANPGRPRPTIYQNYRWESDNGTRTLYLSKAIAPEVRLRIELREPVESIVRFIRRRSRRAR